MQKLYLLLISFAAFLLHEVQADNQCPCLINNGQDALTGKKKDQCKKPTIFTGPAKGDQEEDLVSSVSSKKEKERVLRWSRKLKTDNMNFCNTKEKYLFEAEKNENLHLRYKQAKILYKSAYFKSKQPQKCDAICAKNTKDTLKQAYDKIVSLKIESSAQEDITKKLRGIMNSPSIQVQYQMNFGDNGFETKQISHTGECMKQILENGWLFNKVPIVYNSPIAEFKEFQKTLQDEYDNFWSPFEKELKGKAGILKNKDTTMFYDSIKVGSFAVKTFSKVLSKQIVAGNQHHKKSSKDLAEFRFHKATYDVRVNIAKILLAKSYTKFVSTQDQVNRLNAFTLIHKQQTQRILDQRLKWKNATHQSLFWKYFLPIFPIVLISICLDIMFNEQRGIKLITGLFVLTFCECSCFESCCENEELPDTYDMPDQ